MLSKRTIALTRNIRKRFADKMSSIATANNGEPTSVNTALIVASLEQKTKTITTTHHLKAVDLSIQNMHCINNH